MRQFKNKGQISNIWSNQSAKDTLANKLIKGNLAEDNSSMTTKNTNYQQQMSYTVSELETKTASAVDSMSVVDPDGLPKVSSETEVSNSSAKNINTDQSQDNSVPLSNSNKYPTLWALLNDTSGYHKKNNSDGETVSNVMHPEVDDYSKFNVSPELN